MLWLWILLGVAAGLLIAVLIAAHWAYRRAFSVPKVPDEVLYSLPDNKTYRPYLAESSRGRIWWPGAGSNR